MKSIYYLPGSGAVLALAAMFAGCASVQAPLPPSLELPKPPTDLRAVRKGNRVYLFWTAPTRTIDHQSVRRPGPTRICRSLQTPMTTCGMPVGNLAPVARPEEQNRGMAPVKPEASFVDTLAADLQEQNPTRLVSYAVEPLNLEARSAGLSNRAQVGLAPTLPPPSNFRANATAGGVTLTWDRPVTAPPTPDISYLCRISRKSLDTGTDARLADLDCNVGRFLDASIAWQKPYGYRITTVTSAKLDKAAAPCPGKKAGEGDVSSLDCTNVVVIEGDDSPPQTVFTDDVYPPAVPTGLQAVFSGPGQQPFVDLLWAPNTDADLAGYNVYRREQGGRFGKINADLVKTPAYRDPSVLLNQTYGYSVSAVDERGNESARSEEATEVVPPEP